MDKLVSFREPAGRGDRVTVMPAVGMGVGSAVGTGVGSGVTVKVAIRSMSKSPSCQGWSETDQVRVPAVASSVAEDAGSERDTEPSSPMKSSLWPEREA